MICCHFNHLFLKVTGNAGYVQGSSVVKSHLLHYYAHSYVDYVSDSHHVINPYLTGPFDVTVIRLRSYKLKKLIGSEERYLDVANKICFITFNAVPGG
jgi:hypothetical protein